jgi:hypothetical protein
MFLKGKIAYLLNYVFRDNTLLKQGGDILQSEIQCFAGVDNIVEKTGEVLSFCPVPNATPNYKIKKK